jgi:serine/threonine-protein kinase RsbW
MKQQFNRQVSALDDIFHFDVDMTVLLSVQLVIEELFTNMVKYNHSTTSDVAIDIVREKDRLVVVMLDHSDKAFDVRKSREADITQALGERKVGGLGLHLARKMVDSLDYEFVNGKNRITFTKRLERSACST